MNRFAGQLLLAILGVTLLSLSAVPLAGVVALERTFLGLPEQFRERVLERSRPDDPLDYLTGLWPAVLPQTRSDPPPTPQNDYGSYRLGFAGPMPFEPMTGPITLPILADPPQRDPVAEAARLDEENARLFELVGEMRTALRTGAAIGASTALVIAALLALVLARALARPLEVVSSAATRLAEGDLGVRVLPAFAAAPQGLGFARWRHPAEIRDLATHFDDMVGALQTAQRERTAMIADIAHDLRSPLAALQLRLDALHAGIVPLEPAEIGVLQGQVALLARLVSDLRLLSLADAGELPFEAVPTELSDWLEQQLEQHRPEAERCGVRLELHAPRGALWARIDPDRFAQILDNLLSNARRATPWGGWIRVEVAPEPAPGSAGGPPERVALRVLDSGPGIPPAMLSTIFDRFVRGSGERRDLGEGGGSGLGLAIVRTLVELHGGSVWAENGDPGACLTVIVPALPPGAVPPGGPDPAPSGGANRIHTKPTQNRNSGGASLG